tara:strand:- start:2602 stop:5154 length:2553 start_codon:yes stop_codon:yes gene_type:complete
MSRLVEIFVSPDSDYFAKGQSITAGSLDVYDFDDLPLSLNLAISDADNLEKRKGTFSKTFMIPATKKNNHLLLSLSHTLSDGVFEAESTLGEIIQSNLKYKMDAQIVVDGVPLFYGKLQIESITDVKGKPEKYNCTFFGQNLDWADELKTKSLKDLYSESEVEQYSQDIINDIQQNSAWFGGEEGNDNDTWEGDYNKVVYPMLSYGQQFDPSYAYSLRDMRPSLWVKHILDRIFNQIGYKIESDFLSSRWFHQLIYPLTATQHADDIVAKFSTLVTMDANQWESGGGGHECHATSQISLNSPCNANTANRMGVKFKYANSVVYDPAGAWVGENSVPPTSSGGNSGMWICRKTGFYRFTCNWKIKYSANRNGTSVLRMQICNNPQSGWGDEAAYPYIVADPSLSTYVGVVGLSEETQDFDIPIGGAEDGLLSMERELYVQEGYGVFFSIGTVGSSCTTTAQQAWAKGSSFEAEFLPWATPEGEYRIKDYLPHKSCMEFVKGLAHMFNLYFWTDKSTKKVYIEPYDGFYSTSNVMDWSQKVDLSKEYSDTFVRTLKRNFIIDYAEDGDDFNLDSYLESNVQEISSVESEPIGLGGYGETLDQTHPKGVYRLDNPHFAACFETEETAWSGIIQEMYDQTTPLVKAPIVPCLWSDAGDLDLVYQPMRPERGYKFKPRILFYKGFDYVSTLQSTSINATPLWHAEAWMISEVQGANVGWATTTQYGTRANFTNWGAHANVLTNPNQAWRDANLNFKDVDMVDPSGNEFRLRGLYFLFWQQLIEELKRLPRKRSVYINLDITDMTPMDLRKLVYLDGEYWRINKIIDYQPHTHNSTRVELIQYRVGDKRYLPLVRR